MECCLQIEGIWRLDRAIVLWNQLAFPWKAPDNYDPGFILNPIHKSEGGGDLIFRWSSLIVACIPDSYDRIIADDMNVTGDLLITADGF